MKDASDELIDHLDLSLTTLTMCVRMVLTKYQPQIVSITNADPGVVELQWAPGWEDGQPARIVGVRGMTELNDRAVRDITLTKVDPTHYSIGINTSEFGAYTTHGELRKAIGFTAFPFDITFEGITYISGVGYMPRSIKSNSDLSVDNLEIVGLMPNAVKAQAAGIILQGISDQDLDVGRFDNAQIELFHVNHQDLTMGRLILPGSGRVGQIKIRRSTHETEFRGLTSLLSQTIGDLTSKLCRARIGDDITDRRLGGYGCKIRLQPPVWPGQGNGSDQISRVTHTLTNNGFESGDLTGWTTESGSFSVFSSPSPAAHGGTKTAGASTGKLYQRIDLVADGVDTGEIDLGVLALKIQAWVLGGSSQLDVRIGIRFLDASLVSLAESFNGTAYKTTTFTQETFSASMPALTRYADVILKCSSFLGTPAYFDDVTAETMLSAIHQDMRPPYEGGKGSVVRPSVYNGRHYKCSIAGGSELTEPTWPLTIGATVTDGTATWETIQALTVFGSVTTAIDRRFFKDAIRNEPPTYGLGVNTGTAQYAIRNVGQEMNYFEIDGGDLTAIFVSGGTFAVTLSPANDDTYTIDHSTLVNNRTRIFVVGAIPSPKVGGFIGAPLALATGFWSYGKLTFLTGLNIGISKEVRDFTLTPYAIVDIDQGLQTFFLDGDVSAFFAEDQRFAIDGADDNDAVYDIVSVTYNSGNDQTEIVVAQAIPSATVAGSIASGPGQFELFERMPFEIAVDDEYMVSAGCDLAKSTCKNKFDNIRNRRAEDNTPGAIAAASFPESKL